MRLYTSLLHCFCLITPVICKELYPQRSIQQRDYSNEKVYRIFYDDKFETVRDIINSEINGSLDIWSNTADYLDILLNEDQWKNILNTHTDLQYEVFLDSINDEIQNTITQELIFNSKSNQMNFNIQEQNDDDAREILGDIFFNEYRNLQTIEIWLKLLQETFPDLVNLEEIGHTSDGHTLNVVHISANNYIDNPDKKTIVITGGLHAREWISISTACYTMYELLLNYGKDKKATKYLDSLDFIFVPIFNPDGYDYSWTTDRLWRKNRQPTSVDQCPGIDIDRSFGYQWAKSEEFPCSESYNGEEPFEALEAQYWDTYLREIKKDYKIFGYLDLHSYSEEILYPYGYSCDALPRDIENLLELAFGLAKAIRLTTRKNYDVIAACKDSGSDLTPGIGGGSALDYMYHNRARWALQIKLRDSGNHGFLLPSKYIRPVGRETYASLMYFCGFILNPEM
ncbi:putative metallocarboxypeptidase ecm14 [Maudiozyma exigua]|uniref:Inactive metallocarboxypeptidase ECM14 n=1 Tax=Maudiozyma exigua TaxID=34358 RepID=A0A9P7BAZ6_MAUEX|nr:putative metallocarboxypeptidase ecm14 [Kazachstania exigua]